MSRLLACLALFGFVGTAAACINDVELPNHEREFRSQYGAPAYSPPAPSPDATNPSANKQLTVAGLVLLAGAAALTFTGRRARS